MQHLSRGCGARQGLCSLAPAHRCALGGRSAGQGSRQWSAPAGAAPPGRRGAPAAAPCPQGWAKGRGKGQAALKRVACRAGSSGSGGGGCAAAAGCPTCFTPRYATCAANPRIGQGMLRSSFHQRREQRMADFSGPDRAFGVCRDCRLEQSDTWYVLSYQQAETRVSRKVRAPAAACCSMHRKRHLACRQSFLIAQPLPTSASKAHTPETACSSRPPCKAAPRTGFLCHLLFIESSLA